MSCNKPAFYKSDSCETIIEVICSKETPNLTCCDKPLKEMTANTSEGAAEKHLPVIEQSGNEITVKVGSVLHPMTEEHSIDWVYLETQKGSQRVHLHGTQEPVARFAIATGDTPIAVYAYCNLHGFWKTEF